MVTLLMGSFWMEMIVFTRQYEYVMAQLVGYSQQDFDSFSCSVRDEESRSQKLQCVL